MSLFSDGPTKEQNIRWMKGTLTNVLIIINCFQFLINDVSGIENEREFGQIEITQKPTNTPTFRRIIFGFSGKMNVIRKYLSFDLGRSHCISKRTLDNDIDLKWNTQKKRTNDFLLEYWSTCASKAWLFFALVDLVWMSI